MLATWGLVNEILIRKTKFKLRRKYYIFDQQANISVFQYIGHFEYGAEIYITDREIGLIDHPIIYVGGVI